MKIRNWQQRELFEELGLKVKAIFYKKVFRKNIKTKKINESRFFWIYYAIVQGRPKMKIDLNEVTQAKWIRIDKLRNFSKENEYSLKGLSHKTIMKIYNNIFKK